MWHVYLAQGRFDESQEVLDRVQADDQFQHNLDVALGRGDPEAIKAAIRAMPETHISYVSLYSKVLAEFESPERILSMLRDLDRDESVIWPRKIHDIAMVAAYFGDPGFALEVKAREASVSTVRLTSVWEPVMSEVRRLPEFKDFVQWPVFHQSGCRPAVYGL